MIGHDYITEDVMPSVFQMIKPFVHFLISIGDLKKMEPPAAGNGDEINSIVFGYLSANTHSPNLTIGFHITQSP